VGDGLRAAPRGNEGAGEGHGASVAVGQRGVADSGPIAMLAGGERMSGVRPAVKQGRTGADRWPHYCLGRWRFEYSSNSNEFNLLQNLPNFDRSKNGLP
jgi:hypothetical protein